MDDERYTRIEQLRRRLDANEKKGSEIRAQLHEAIVDALAGTPPHGAQNEVARRSGYSRERVAQIRKAAEETDHRA